MTCILILFQTQGVWRRRQILQLDSRISLKNNAGMFTISSEALRVADMVFDVNIFISDIRQYLAHFGKFTLFLLLLRNLSLLFHTLHSVRQLIPFHCAWGCSHTYRVL